MPRRLSWQSQADAGHLEHVTVRTATFVVAASDASDAAKSQADWVCTGVADNVDIQEAIDALPAGGGTVILSEGSFNNVAALSIAKDGVRIVGQGRATVISGDGSTAFIDLSGLPRLGFSVAHLDFSGFTGGILTSGALGFFLEDVHAIGMLSAAAFGGPTDYARRGIYLGCQAIDCLGNGFEVGQGSYDVHLVGCVADGCLVGFTFDFNLENTMIGCTARNNTSHGVDLYSSPVRIVVKGNVIVDNGGYGVNETTDSTSCIVTGNVLDNNTSGAVSSHSASTRVFDNIGYATENSGAATLVNGQTSIVVTHGLAVTPAIGDVMVTPIEAWGSMTQFYIDTYTSTQFTIHVDQDPGQDVDFAWKAVVL